MHRFFVGSKQITHPSVTISGSDVAHIRRVLRLQPGQRVEIVDEESVLYEVELEEVGATRVRARVIREIMTAPEEPLAITVAQGVPKGDKMDLIVQKATELGVSRVVPLMSERVVTRPAPERRAARVGRWRKLALEAAKQSKRRSVPRISEFLALEAFCREDECRDLRLILWEEETANRLRSLLVSARGRRSVALIIGPEGGFSREEVEVARSWGFTAVSLGPRILRTETVALSVLSVIQYELGDFG